MEEMFRAYHASKKVDQGAYGDADSFAHLKIGKIARTILRDTLESGKVPDAEIERLQNKEYSKEALHIQYPLLVREWSDYEPQRYYKAPLVINGKRYRLCSQWFEGPANDDRSYLIAWLHRYRGMQPSEGIRMDEQALVAQLERANARIIELEFRLRKIRNLAKA
ncbi:MAG: hypothetical protein LBB58_02570 [Cellulomonadaceae bacterium]|jgi:hypothetical protein|nr:hypothetical protein [Cellulomonadaceae bacterium]